MTIYGVEAINLLTVFALGALPLAYLKLSVMSPGLKLRKRLGFGSNSRDAIINEEIEFQHYQEPREILIIHNETFTPVVDFIAGERQGTKDSEGRVIAKLDAEDPIQDIWIGDILLKGEFSEEDKFIQKFRKKI